LRGHFFGLRIDLWVNNCTMHSVVLTEFQYIQAQSWLRENRITETRDYTLIQQGGRYILNFYQPAHQQRFRTRFNIV
jgi:hypothetical protein